MRDAILALSLVLALTCVDQSEGLECYGCNSTKEDGCFFGKGERRRLICGSDTKNGDMRFIKIYNNDLSKIQDQFIQKQKFYQTKTKYADKVKESTRYIAEIENILKLNVPPPPFYEDDAIAMSGKKFDAFLKYNTILETWKIEDREKGNSLWDKISPQLKDLKAKWKGTEDMPQPPRWSDIYYFCLSALEYDQYSDLLDEWIQAAKKAMSEGVYNDSFHKQVQRKCMSLHHSNGVRSSRQTPPKGPGTNSSLFENLPLDNSWCSSFQSPSLGMRTGCGVKLHGFVFKDGCHDMQAPHKGIKYCRCNKDGCPQENDIFGKINGTLTGEPSGNKSHQHSHFPHANLTWPKLNDGSVTSPCLLMLAVTFIVTVTLWW